MTEWLPLMDYAVKSGVSLSTLRRHIKANKIKYRKEQGKYFVSTDPAELPNSWAGEGARTDGGVSVDARMAALEDQLNRTQEEVAELKMLLALYEERIPHPSN